ncbi:MAG: DNA repair exonuclease [Gammaproteobacteria bacterium]|jgi:predicted phosphodiesterase|nr:DNA repair exonuclease [Gammaproteobacteria bacterium]
MFRFIHAADTHIDSPLVGLDAYEGAPVELLRGATRRAFENLVELALEEAVDFVLIAGDLYDGDWRDFSTGLFFTRQMARLREAAIPVYVIAGNHDAASVLTRRLDPPDNVHFFSTRQPETRELEQLPVAIHGRGFPNRQVPENLVPDYPPPRPGRFNIGLLHTSLAGAPGHATYAPCTLADLAAKGYDYWALGHVHQPQVLARAPWVIFPGNLQGRHVRETGARGCQLVRVDEALQVVDAVHRPLDVVRWARLEVDLTGIDAPESALVRVDDALTRALDDADGRLLATRLALAGHTPLHGGLARSLPAWRAQCQARAQITGGDRVWIEDLELATAPVYDLQRLAERDDLTRILLAGLAAAECPTSEPAAGSASGPATEPASGPGTGPTAEAPPEVRDLLGILPAEIRTELEDALTAEQRPALLAEVRALLLESLRHSGGDNGGDSGGEP